MSQGLFYPTPHPTQWPRRSVPQETFPRILQPPPTPGDGLLVYIMGHQRPILESSLRIEQRVNSPASASFTVIDEDSSIFLQDGMDVVIVNTGLGSALTADNTSVTADDTTITADTGAASAVDELFGGFISNVSVDVVTRGKLRYHRVECDSLDELARNRIISEVYTNTSVLAMVRDIVENVLSEEFVDDGFQSFIDSTPSRVEFFHRHVDEALNELGEMGGGLLWYIRPEVSTDGTGMVTRNLDFFAIGERTTSVVLSSSNVMYDNLNAQHWNPEYRNRQIILGEPVDVIGSGGSVFFATRERPAEISRRKNLSAASGKVEVAESYQQVTTSEEAFTLADAKLDRWGRGGKRLRLRSTKLPVSLPPGTQVRVHLPELGVHNNDLTVESMSVTGNQGSTHKLEWSYSLVDGAAVPGWQQLLKENRLREFLRLSQSAGSTEASPSEPTVFADDFNRSGSTGVGNGWQKLGHGDWEIDTDRLKGTLLSNGGVLVRPSSEAFRDGTVTAKVFTGNPGGVTGRHSTSNQAGYICEATPTSLILARFSTGGARTNIAQNGITFVSGAAVEMEMMGSDFDCRYNGALRITASDFSLSSGVPGVFGRFLAGSTSARIDDYSHAEST